MANVFTKRLGQSDWTPVVEDWSRDDAMRLMESILKCRDSNERVAIEGIAIYGDHGEKSFHVYARTESGKIHLV